MILAFKKNFNGKPTRFDDKIEAAFYPKSHRGIHPKYHSIRSDENDRWKRGREIHMAYGVRTKNYSCFNLIPCTGTQRIFMTYAYNDIIEISVDGHELFGYHERLALARNDGFDSWEEFFEWFYPVITNSKDGCFSGKLVHWTNHRYLKGLWTKDVIQNQDQ